MAILNLKKNIKKDNQAKKTVKLKPTVSNDSGDNISQAGLNSSIITRPRFTEKAYDLQTKNVYVFEVSSRATKSEIKKSIKALYKVEAEKIRIVNLKPKTVMLRGKASKTRGIKKAYVYLKAGDKIDLV